MAVADSELFDSLLSEGEPPFLSAHRISSVLGIEPQELAALVGVTEEALAAHSSSSEGNQALRSLVRILSMAIEMTGERNKAAIWFKHQPIPGWAGKTAYDLVGEDKADKVSDYLASVQSGVYA